ncbi:MULTISPECIES: hypothetical protein [unclassified Acinetobacter]|uniref:hypothetical protein n=1 Tax=unclassified Acinetobacter TaxID=196816 RepID=UPI0015D30C75|nr:MULTISPECIES: hypothetical protein [unclassified Acinetobacter]
MDGAPYSVNAAIDPNSMTSQLSLLESRNVEFQSIELQIWQGKGSQRCNALSVVYWICVVDSMGLSRHRGEKSRSSRSFFKS